MNIKTISALLCTAAALSSGNPVIADEISSANHKIFWDAANSGNELLMSSNYNLKSTVGESMAAGLSTSTGYELLSGFETAPDDDNDTVKSFMDNCIYDPNASQYDSNGDGYGNLCDPDFDNNGIVNFLDYPTLTSRIFTNPQSPNWDPDVDLNGDGLINFLDIGTFPFFVLSPPGPSAIAP